GGGSRQTFGNHLADCHGDAGLAFTSPRAVERGLDPNVVHVGKPPGWVSANDVILEMLRRHGGEGGLGRIIEYYGPRLESLSAIDRHLIANMGAPGSIYRHRRSC